MGEDVKADAPVEASCRQGDVLFLFDAARIAAGQLASLFAAPGGTHDAAPLLGGGRAPVVVATHQGRRYVLRHYRRGGALASLSGDRYVWNGAALSRPWREWRLLACLHAEGFAVPRPLAARLVRGGLIYRADLATELIAGARTLAEALRHAPLDESRWRALGALLSTFHRRGVCHADLNANNVLLDETGGLWLIDFDRARIRRAGAGWREANLARLRRSLDKLADAGGPLYLAEADWAALRDAYCAANTSGSTRRSSAR